MCISANANQPLANALIFISDSDSIDASRNSNSVYRIGLDGRGLKRIVGAIPHADGYLRTSGIACHAPSQILLIASHRRDLNGFHRAQLDGSGLHFDQPAGGELLTSTRQIAIAPDAERIIVSRQFDEFDQPRFGLVAGDFYSRHFNTIKPPTAALSYHAPAWSPSGRSIAYIIEGHDSDSSTYQLAIAWPSGQFELIVHETPMRISDVAWSPAGDWLALEINRQIYRLRPGGGELSQLTENPGGASSPRFSPDGRQIAYASASSFPAYTQIMLMNADGSDKQPPHQHPRRCRHRLLGVTFAGGCQAEITRLPSLRRLSRELA